MSFKRSDMLSDRSGFSAGDIGFADGVDQACFTVVDVAHEGNDRAAEGELIRRSFSDLLFNGLIGDFETLFFTGIDGDFAIEIVTEKLDGCFIIDEIVQREHDAFHEEIGDQLRGFQFHLDSEIFNSDRNADF